MVVVAQLVERRTVNPQVAGSSPVDHPKYGTVAERLKALALKAREGVSSVLRGFESYRFRF
jgi:hypothetical protein